MNRLSFQIGNAMKIHCLGTAGYHPNDRRQTSCYYLPESGIALDAGTGMYRLPNVMAGNTLDILLSHAHLDHTAGLTFLLELAATYPVERIQIWGEAEKLEAVQEHLFHPLMFPAKLQATWHPIDDLDEFRIGGVRLTWRRQEHPGGSVAYRLEWQDGKRLVYSTDTTGDTSEEHIAWSYSADLLLHECNFSNKDVDWALTTGHSWTDRVAQVARLSSPKKLLLTHLNPLETSPDPIESALIQEQLEGELVLAEDGLEVSF